MIQILAIELEHNSLLVYEFFIIISLPAVMIIIKEMIDKIKKRIKK